MNILMLLLVLAFYPAAAAHAQGITIESLLSSPFPSELTASPDGKRLAWLANERGMRNVFGAEAPAFVPRQLTSFNDDDGQEMAQLTWSPDSEHLLFVRGGSRNSAGEFPNPASDPGGADQSIWIVRFSGGLPRKLAVGADPDISSTGQIAYVQSDQIWTVPISGSSQPRQLFNSRGRNGSPVWSPDGVTLAFVSEREDHSFIGLYQAAGGSLHYVAPSVDRDTLPRWSPDGASIAFVRQPGRGGDPAQVNNESLPQPWAIWISEVRTLRSRPIWASAATVEASFPRLAGDNILRWGTDSRLIFASEHDGWMHYYSVPASGGNATLLTPGDCETEDSTISQDGRYLFFSSNCGDVNRRHLWLVPVAGGQPKAITSGSGIEWKPTVLAGGFMAFLRSDAIHPAVPFLYEVSSRSERALLGKSGVKDFPADSIVTPEPILFKSPDGWEIHGQLFMPKSKTAGKLPAVIFMHGGPIRQMLLGWHNRYYYHNAYAMNQYLVSLGYAVLSVNYRSGIGYGRAFREAPGRGAHGATEYQDIVAAAHYLRGRSDIDGGRIGLWGGSYGGYLTALGLARNSELFAAGVDLHGVHDWSAPGFRSRYGTESPELIKKARESSPVASVETWKSPVLLIHGDDDRNVGFSQTVDLAQRLRAQKVDFEQLVFPDEIHDFLLHRHWVEAYRAAADFFDRRLKGR